MSTPLSILNTNLVEKVQIIFPDANGQPVQVSAENPLPTTGGGGGGSPQKTPAELLAENPLTLDGSEIIAAEKSGAMGAFLYSAVHWLVKTTGAIIAGIGAATGDTGTAAYTKIGQDAGSGHDSGAFTPIMIGFSAGKNDTGAGNHTIIGSAAGQDSNCSNLVALGYRAGISTNGNNMACVGAQAAQGATCFDGVMIGNEAGAGSNTNSLVAVGSRAGKDSTGDNKILLGADAGKEGTDGRVAIFNFGSIRASVPSGPMNAFELQISVVDNGIAPVLTFRYKNGSVFAATLALV